MKKFFWSFAALGLFLSMQIASPASAEQPQGLSTQASFTAHYTNGQNASFSVDGRRPRRDRSWCVRRRRHCANLAAQHRCRSHSTRPSRRCGGWRCLGFACRF
jgi:hypothetical protein